MLDGDAYFGVGGVYSMYISTLALQQINIVLYIFSMAGADKFMVFLDNIPQIADNRAEGGEAYPHRVNNNQNTALETEGKAKGDCYQPPFP